MRKPTARRRLFNFTYARIFPFASSEQKVPTAQPLLAGDLIGNSIP